VPFQRAGEGGVVSATGVGHLSAFLAAMTNGIASPAKRRPIARRTAEFSHSFDDD
jgi:hypothetical protein